MNLFLFLGGIFLFTFLFGILLEKIKIPWIFAALILGFGTAFYNPFLNLTSSQTFKFLAWLGMYFLLFLIGFELNLEKIKKLGKFIIAFTLFIIFFEAIFGSLLIHFVFGYPWFVSILVALSFATVGEAVLIPILEKFKLTKTKLAQTILGMATLDDIIEVLIIILLVMLLPIWIGGKEKIGFEIGDILIIFFSLFSLFLFAFGVVKLKEKISRMRVKEIEAIFILILAIFFLFVGLGKFGEAGAIGAILSGLVVKNFLPKERILAIESEIKTLSFAFFGPVFFFWVGKDINVNYLISAPFLVFLVILVSYSSKILASFLIGRKKFGKKASLFMGTALGVRFSTSIVIVKFLFEKGLIGSQLYSVLIGATFALTFIIPFLLSFLITKWKLVPPS